MNRSNIMKTTGNLPAPAAARITNALAVFPPVPDEVFADMNTVSAETARPLASLALLRRHHRITDECASPCPEALP